jgi:hypothetical protein
VAFILALVLGMVVLAIAAKTLHYSPATAQTRYFSSSVKIAKLRHAEQGRRARMIVAVAAHCLHAPSPLGRQQPISVVPRANAGRITARQPRAPPVLS